MAPIQYGKIVMSIAVRGFDLTRPIAACCPTLEVLNHQRAGRPNISETRQWGRRLTTLDIASGSPLLPVCPNVALLCILQKALKGIGPPGQKFRVLVEGFEFSIEEDLWTGVWKELGLPNLDMKSFVPRGLAEKINRSCSAAEVIMEQGWSELVQIYSGKTPLAMINSRPTIDAFRQAVEAEKFYKKVELPNESFLRAALAGPGQVAFVLMVINKIFEGHRRNDLRQKVLKMLGFSGGLARGDITLTASVTGGLANVVLKGAALIEIRVDYNKVEEGLFKES